MPKSVKEEQTKVISIEEQRKNNVLYILSQFLPKNKKNEEIDKENEKTISNKNQN